MLSFSANVVFFVALIQTFCSNFVDKMCAYLLFFLRFVQNFEKFRIFATIKTLCVN